MWRLILLVAGVLGGAFPAAAATSTREGGRPSLIIRNANVVDVRSGRVLPDQTVVVTGRRISSISPAAEASAARSASTIHAAGAYLIPGLIDTHTHQLYRQNGILAQDNLDRFLDNGVTAIRHAGNSGQDAALVRARERARRGEIRSPRISVSGMINGRIVAMYRLADAKSVAEHLVKLGVDGLKVRDWITIEDVREVIAVGKAAGLPVYGHTYDVVAFRNVDYSAAAVASGLSGIMHVPNIVPRDPAALPKRPSDPEAWQADWLWTRLGWLSLPAQEQKSLIRLMVERGAWLEPTLVTEHFIAYREQHEAVAAERGALDLIKDAREGFPAFTGQDLALYRQAYEHMAAFVRDFARAGGIVLAGTDCTPTCGYVQDELALLVEAGLSPLRALQAGTINAATALRFDDIGRVEVGATADLLLIDGNPLDNIRHTRSIIAVVQGGKVVKRRTR